jgi:plasmid stabilization system protein ParE
LKITYTEEAVADIVEAITYLNERDSSAAAKLDAAITRCVERLAAPRRSVRNSQVPPHFFKHRPRRGWCQ